jgi:hypothetical protein
VQEGLGVAGRDDRPSVAACVRGTRGSVGRRRERGEIAGREDAAEVVEQFAHHLDSGDLVLVGWRERGEERELVEDVADVAVVGAALGRRQ